VKCPLLRFFEVDRSALRCRSTSEPTRRKRDGNRNRVGSEELGLLVSSLLHQKKSGGSPAVSVRAGSFAVELDCSCFLGCGSQVACCVAEPDPAGSCVVVVEVQLLAGEHRQSTPCTGFAVRLWQEAFAELLVLVAPSAFGGSAGLFGVGFCPCHGWILMLSVGLMVSVRLSIWDRLCV
jgi:hypothetical protein